MLLLLSGSPIEQNGSRKLLNMVDTIVSSLYPKSHRECTLLIVMDKTTQRDVFGSRQEKDAIIRVTEDYLARHKEHLSTFLQQQTGCAVGSIAGRESFLKDLAFSLRKVESNVILKMDGIQPKPSTLASSDYPMAWTENVKNEHNSYFLNIYCPKEEQLKSTIVRFSLAKPYDIKCPHYLKGQNLGLGHIPHHIKKLINGKSVYGDNYVRFFEYVSKMFRFRPWYKPGRIIYFPKNDSWGGLQQQVHSYFCFKLMKVITSSDLHLRSLRATY